ncbi:CPBP family intramembrane glutamic endopeptidase [Roseivirga sp. BDSF3-8]|uniref:CPBP family intramembrane glutamic endopeptidase n=1 Tax=Roseivirga sp. BDSF3-8 TaxID=3241598 RepID=UPI00353195D2
MNTSPTWRITAGCLNRLPTMRHLIGLIKKHYQEDFHWPSSLIVFIFLVAAIVINSYLDIEDYYIDKVWAGHPIRVLWFFLLFSVPYYLSCWVLHAYGLTGNAFLSRGFYARSVFILICMAFDSSFSWHWEWIRSTFDMGYAYWLLRCSNNLLTLFTIFLPLGIYYYLAKERTGFYGLGNRNIHWQGYLVLLACVAPLVAGASFTEGFQDAYPRYTPYYTSDLPGWIKVVVYELTYGLSFISVELIFRGFLVIGMLRILGPQAILPMAALYCVYHFGKPPMEAFSSIFGGYLLGILAYYSRSIIGGILLHVGLAWMMELAAWLQRQ